MFINKKNIIVMLSIVISVLTFFILFRLVDVKEVILSLNRVDFSLVFIGLGFYAITYLIRAFRFYVLLKREEITYYRMLIITFIHQFYYRVIPFKAGEFSLLYLLKKTSNINLGESAGILLFVRFFDIISIAILFFICNSLTLTTNSFSGIFILTIAIILVLMVFTPKIISILNALVSNLNRKIKVTLLDKLSVNLKVMNTGFSEIISSKANLIGILILSLGNWVILYLSMYYIVKSFNIDISYITTVIGSSLAVISTLLPVNGVGGFGAVEAGWTAGFTLMGVNEVDALASGILFNLSSFVIVCVFGVLGHVLIILSRGNK